MHGGSLPCASRDSGVSFDGDDLVAVLFAVGASGGLLQLEADGFFAVGGLAKVEHGAWLRGRRRDRLEVAGGHGVSFVRPRGGRGGSLG
ncbi:hypothetical protein ACFPRL_30085 [Pseudoclavibacter helvolus]